MSYEQEKARAEARRWQRIANAHDLHVAAHNALREQHRAEPPKGNYFVQQTRQAQERKALDDALGEGAEG